MQSSYWERLSKQRFSRRCVLKAGTGLGVAGGLALAACGGGEEEPSGGETPSAELTPVPGGKLVRGIGTDPLSLDVEQSVVGYFVAGAFYDYLHGVTFEDQKVELLMAESLERPDDLTYIWKLRPGIKFHDIEPTNGREVTAADVTYSFTRLKDDPASQWSKTLLKEYTTSFGDSDQYTFKLLTTRPYAPTVDHTCLTCYAVQPKEAVEKWGDLARNAAGCGPFILDDFVRGERVKMRKNPDYYKPGLPYLDAVEWLVIPDNSTLLQAFKTKQHDICGWLIDRLTQPEMENLDGVVLRESPNLYTPALIVKVDEPPFDDERVREAVDLAIDRQDIIDKMNFGEGKFAGPIVGDLEFWALPQEELREFYKVDIEKAKQLLSAAGHADGLEVDLVVENIVTLPKLAEVFKEHFSKIGLKVNLVVKELGVYLAQHLYARNFKMTIYLNLPWSDPDTPLLNWFSEGPPGFSFTGYNNPEMDEWIWKERSEFDAEKRQAIVRDAQRAMIREHGPQFPLTTQVFRSAAWDWVHFGETRFWGLLGPANQGAGIWLSQRH